MKVQPVRMSRARDTPVRLRPGGVCQFKYRRARHSSLYRRARVGPSITPPGAAVVNQAAREAHVSALRASILTPLGLSACAHRLRRLTVQISSASFRSGQHVCCEQAGINVGQIHRHPRAAPQRAQCRNSVRVVFLQGLSRAQDSGLTLIPQLPTVKNTPLDKGHLNVAVPRVFSVRTHESSKPRRQSMKVGMHPGNSFGTKATGCIR